MGILQLLVAMLAIYLFLVFLVQPFLIAWRVLSAHFDDPPDVHALFESWADGGIPRYRADREASGQDEWTEDFAPRRDDKRGPRLALGWKGFDANSSPWEILGVARDASVDQIKAAYRRLVKKFHPDYYQSLSEAEIAELERDTKLIHAAYAKLV